MRQDQRRRRTAAGHDLLFASHYAEWWNCPSYAFDRLATLIPWPVPPMCRPARDRLSWRRFGAWGGLIAGTPPEVADALSEEVDLGA